MAARVLTKMMSQYNDMRTEDKRVFMVDARYKTIQCYEVHGKVYED